ncbi:MAG: lysophospholipid acyltransferase family protein [Alcanivoracaceae bacterium]
MVRILHLIHVWLIFIPVVVLSTLFFGMLCLLVVPFLGPARTARITAVPWARLGLFVSGVKVHIDGAEHVRPGQSYVIAANHLSHFDIWVLYGWLGMDLRWVMKQELRNVPVIGISCEALGHIFIDRSNRQAALASLDAARDRITPGTSILFFPEGTRSRDGILKPFKKGAFNMALDLQLPVLPVTIDGTRDILPAGTLQLNPGEVRITLHQAIPVQGLSEADLDDLAQRTRSTIAGALKEEGARAITRTI